MFTRAIVRPPSANFADGLTSVDLGKPNFELALEQHEAYCRALAACGLSLIRLEADERYPDSTFVEDTAVLTARGAVITQPGAASRLGEIDDVEPVLQDFFTRFYAIHEEGRLHLDRGGTRTAVQFGLLPEHRGQRWRATADKSESD